MASSFPMTCPKISSHETSLSSTSGKQSSEHHCGLLHQQDASREDDGTGERAPCKDNMPTSIPQNLKAHRACYHFHYCQEVEQGEKRDRTPILTQIEHEVARACLWPDCHFKCPMNPALLEIKYLSTT